MGGQGQGKRKEGVRTAPGQGPERLPREGALEPEGQAAPWAGGAGGDVGPLERGSWTATIFRCRVAIFWVFFISWPSLYNSVRRRYGERRPGYRRGVGQVVHRFWLGPLRRALGEGLGRRAGEASLVMGAQETPGQSQGTALPFPPNVFPRVAPSGRAVSLCRGPLPLSSCCPEQRCWAAGGAPASCAPPGAPVPTFRVLIRPTPAVAPRGLGWETGCPQSPCQPFLVASHLCLQPGLYHVSLKAPWDPSAGSLVRPLEREPAALT